MGHPKFSRRVWQGPKHPWQAERIEEERTLIFNYGLRNHREIWKARSKLRRWRSNAMKLIATTDSGEDDHVSREKADLITSLHRRGLLPEGASLDDVLRLNVDHVLARRLQSQVYYKGLAASPKQARQLLIHGHISIGNQVMTVPGYIITREEEAALQYSSSSELANEQHPLRQDIVSIRSMADYANEEEESTLELTNDGAPSAEEVQELAEAVAAAPSSDDVSGGES
ncbi:MAG: 30S ribosomal protein S4 [Candidatus Thalassarchaeaceae archaeon]|jgi:small subunit ribosomal protein S4|nr:30S ribosomal protein S4 [Candidatus Thalassarchaeaceae archaeon]MDP7043607.1 30S ribosomal protein S4 [Candidatus Thalassarchaeaceae archaeon]